jgi:hypothetical protein
MTGEWPPVVAKYIWRGSSLVPEPFSGNEFYGEDIHWTPLEILCYNWLYLPRQARSTEPASMRVNAKAFLMYLLSGDKSVGSTERTRFLVRVRNISLWLGPIYFCKPQLISFPNAIVQQNLTDDDPRQPVCKCGLGKAFWWSLNKKRQGSQLRRCLSVSHWIQTQQIDHHLFFHQLCSPCSQYIPFSGNWH